MPYIVGLKRLIILVDHDTAGKEAAAACAARWSRSIRNVVLLTPKAEGADFNDLVTEMDP